MPTNTYVALDKVTANGSVSSITFSSIASTYTDLVLVIQGANSNVSNARWKINGDTGTNYSWTGLGGSGSATVSTRIANTSTPQLDWYGYFDSNQSNLIAHFMNYSNTTTFKTVLTRSNNAANGVAATVGLWRNTAAITTIEIVSSNGNWNSGTTFSLYGIAAQAVPGTAKATGGTITYDNFGRVMHTFTSSGTFTPSQNLQCEYLVIAGGGGGGSNRAAGGGAGGFRTAEGFSVSGSTGYTVTVGAGGAGGAGGNNSTFNDGSSGSNSVFGSITSAGGGGGVYGNSDRTGIAGGSGGGAAQGYYGGPGTGGAGNTPATTPSQGNNGGNGGSSGYSASAGGGGGAGSVGQTGYGSGGNGGYGLASSISGTSVAYAGGGGGSTDYRGGGSGGTGRDGGGNGGVTGAGANATANTGSGGGGGGMAADTFYAQTGGNGGSGIVIIRYQG